MRIKNTISIPTNIVQYIADDFLRLLGMDSPNEIYIATLDPESLELVSRFNIKVAINKFYKPCIDNNCIYLPAKTGQILVLDKFSGELMSVMNLGPNYIMSDILQTQDFIICVSAVPINTKLKLHLNRYCIFIFGKSDYKKIVQTSYFVGPPSFLSLSGKHLYTAGKEDIHKFTLAGELVTKTKHVSSNIPIVHTESHVVCCEKSGKIKALNCDRLDFHSIAKGKEMESLPVSLSNKILWFSKNGICQIDIGKQVSSYFPSNGIFSSPEVLITKKHLFGCDQEGKIISFGLNSKNIHIIKLTNGRLRSPVVADKYLFTLSNDKLHQVEIEDEM